VYGLYAVRNPSLFDLPMESVQEGLVKVQAGHGSAAQRRKLHGGCPGSAADVQNAGGVQCGKHSEGLPGVPIHTRGLPGEIRVYLKEDIQRFHAPTRSRQVE